MESSLENMYEVEELSFYLLELELQSVMWFSSLTQPHLKVFVQTQIPVIHNYPLLLAMKGYIVEESYVSKYNELKNTAPPSMLFNKLGLYVYPLMLEKIHYTRFLLSMAETDYVFYKLKTRLAVPIMTSYNALAPGTRGLTIAITPRDAKIPEKCVLRLGAKRFGVWRIMRTSRAYVHLINGPVKATTPFNIKDVKYLLSSPVVVLKHYAGDIAISGVFEKALEVRVRDRVFIKPIPFFISI
uniref:Type I-D CRISPR-associated protein Cas5/Csc1 n=1 Tax=Staphylothermus marinus TaxID=2280 RepID=A0A7J3PKX5_STAMA